MFGKRVTLFRLLGFDVRVDISWVVLAVLVVWSLAVGFFPIQYPDLPAAVHWWMALGGALGLFLSIVIHEFSHSLVARKYGIPMNGITLFIFGGIAEMDEEPPNATAEFRMAIVGPFASLVLAGALYLVYQALPGAWREAAAGGVIFYLALINGILAVFNLFPAFPLDGGRALRAWLWRRRGDLVSATRTASSIGSGFGALLIGLGILQVLAGNLIGGMWWALIGLFVRNAAAVAYQRVEIQNALAGVRVRDLMTADPATVSADARIADVVEDYVYRYRHHAFPVVENGRAVGLVGVRELGAVPREDWDRKTIRERMQPSSDDNTIEPDTGAMDAMNQMNRTGNRRLLVRAPDRTGIVTVGDIVGFLDLKFSLDGGPLGRQELVRLAATPN